MDGSSLGPLTLWQRVFWFAAIAVLIIDLLLLFAPPGRDHRVGVADRHSGLVVG